ncbi:MAG: biopolymer transporter ExbD [Candidatus Marinimicrobia bacterium]|jgi:biopolymer transport protein ExbD|nr:biopolymer transporter ExbD [Candidatus Neomarinimicrobiota bacterium]MDD4960652.1 biopolymer transporter ExbD [Candidatus Neomarinimicrobiota bacterium]MDD5709851.1 biopolymer transporter ExbD [Candidatus Neomarinimicrobiota bacterium]MDX9777541.1 biopolymer transporter ExbD [bacterium]
MAIKRKSKSRSGIPTATMSDIIFMLLIFFMAATSLKTVEGLKVNLPRARSIAKLDTPKQSVLYVFIDRTGRISIQDKLMETDVVASVIYPMRRNDNMLTISLRADQETQMGIISDVQNQLRDASALKVNYSAKHK